MTRPLPQAVPTCFVDKIFSFGVFFVKQKTRRTERTVYAKHSASQRARAGGAVRRRRSRRRRVVVRVRAAVRRGRAGVYALALAGAPARRSRERRERRSGPPRHFLLRLRRRRRVEDHQLRSHLDPRLPLATHPLKRRNRRPPF